MANCEEKPCANLQSAICLHCNRRLCAPHIIVHRSALLKEANELCEQINQTAECLNDASKQIHTIHSDDMNELGVWRQRQIDEIEHEYAKQLQAIESKQDYLVDLESNLAQQLTKYARVPLERMQIQQSANNQVINAIRQAIIDIRRKSVHLEWDSTEPISQLSPFSMENIAPSPHSQYYQLQTPVQQQYANNIPQNYFQQQTPVNPVVRQWVINQPYQLNQSPANNLPSGFQQMVAPQCPFGQREASSRPYYIRPTVASTTPVYQYRTQLTPAPFIRPVNGPAGYSSGKLVTYFKNVSGLSDLILDNFIVHNLNRVVDFNCMMTILLSFLEAWHSTDSPTVYNERVLSYHIFAVKKYIKEPEHELTVLIAIQVFVNACNHAEIRSCKMMVFLLQHFHDHQCISKANILNWYENGASYGYSGFQTAKLWAKSFVDLLNITVQPKQT